MINRLILRLKNSIWIYPAIISTVSFFAAIGIGFLDSGIFIKLYEIAPTLMLTSVGLSINILTVIAASLITMTTFTFSTTMVVLITYSTQFSPRTVENFLSDDKTMKALGVFMGGFVYSIMALLFMRRNLGEQLVVSSSLAIIYAIVCLIEFIRYIQHVGSYILTSNLINRLYIEAEKTIENYKELVSDADVVKDLGWIEKGLRIKYQSKKTGYIQLISYNELKKTAKDIDGAIILGCEHGDFVQMGNDLFTVIYSDESKIEQEKIEIIADVFTIGNKKSELQDFNFSIQKISEIALRAISPGINDPNTAIHCIKIMGVLLNKLNQFEIGYIAMKSDEQGGVLIFSSTNLTKVLRTSFHQLVHYGKTDISVMLSILEALKYTALNANDVSKKDISKYFEYVWSNLDTNNILKYDMNILVDARDNFEAVISQ